MNTHLNQTHAVWDLSMFHYYYAQKHLHYDILVRHTSKLLPRFCSSHFNALQMPYIHNIT
jgi:hypothetical protein